MMGSAAAPSIAARLLKVLDIESSPCAMAGYGPPCQQPRQPRSARFFAKICHYGTGQAGWRTLVWLDMSAVVRRLAGRRGGRRRGWGGAPPPPTGFFFL